MYKRQGYKGAIYNSETYELVMEIDDFSTIDDVIPLDAGSYRLTCTTKDVDTSFSFIEGAKSGVIKFEIEESTITETKLYIYNDNSNSGGYGNSKIKINYSQSFLNQFGDNYKAVYTADYTERNYKQNTSTGELTLGSEKSFDIQVNFEDSDSLFLNMYEYTFYGDVQNKTISKKHSNGIISITAGTNKISTILDKSVLEAGIYYIINVDYKSLKGGLEMNVVIDNSYEKKIFDVVFTDEEQ